MAGHPLPSQAGQGKWALFPPDGDRGSPPAIICLGDVKDTVSLPGGLGGHGLGNWA